MDMEKNRSQFEVFFLATLVLFPGSLTKQALDPWFFRPYFNFFYDNDFDSDENKDASLKWASVIFDDYQNKGYIKYKKVDSLYKITEINTEKATKDLIQYLQKWQQNKILPLSASKPPEYKYQQGLLLNAIARAYTTNQKRPRISLEDVYGQSGDYSYKPPFWELILSNQLLDKKIEIKCIDYDRNDDNGFYYDNQRPYVDFEIIDEELINQIGQLISQDAKDELRTTSGSISVNFSTHEDMYEEAAGLPCDFTLLERGIFHVNGKIVYESVRGNGRKLLDYLMEHKRVVSGGKMTRGKELTLAQLQEQFADIGDLARELKRISVGLTNSGYSNAIYLTLPKNVRQSTSCQIICRQ